MKILYILLISIILIGCTNQNQLQQPQQINVEVVEPEKRVLASSTTPITDKTKNRMNNLNISISKLNGHIVQPNEVFSFNDTVGERTEEAGFKKAIIFDGNGNKEKGIGGGICQSSSTLYLAAQQAGMEIIERHEHSHEVQYVEKGQDATVSYGTVDFKFRNTHAAPIKINASSDKQNITISLEEV